MYKACRKSFDTDLKWLSICEFCFVWLVVGYIVTLTPLETSPVTASINVEYEATSRDIPTL